MYSLMASCGVPLSARCLPLQKHRQQLLPACSSSSLPSSSYIPDKRMRHIEGLKQVYIPKIPTVLPVKISPSYERNRRHCDEWTVSAFHRFQTEEQKSRMLKEKIPLALHLVYPEGVESRLLWITKLMIWFVIFDSDMDNMEQFGSDLKATVNCIQEYTSFLEYGKVTNVNNDLLSVFATLWQEAVETMPVHHYRRFRDDTMKMFQSNIKQNKLRVEGQIPGSIGELLAARRETGYITALTHLVEFIIGMDVDKGVEKAVDTTIADDYITLTNDLISMRQEYLNKDYHNVPCTIAILNNVSLDEAMQQTLELIQGMVDRYNQVRDSVLQAHPNSPQVKAYVDGLGYTMAGLLEWSWHTGRYHGPHWVTPQEREGFMYLNAGKTATFVPASKLV